MHATTEATTRTAKKGRPAGGSAGRIDALAGAVGGPGVLHLEDAARPPDRLGIDRAVVSAGGVHAERGASRSNVHEVAVKRAVLHRDLHRTPVVDGSKPGTVRPAFFAALDAFDAFVTTAAAHGQAAAVRVAFPGPFILARPS